MGAGKMSRVHSALLCWAFMWAVRVEGVAATAKITNTCEKEHMVISRLLADQRRYSRAVESDASIMGHNLGEVAGSREQSSMVGDFHRLLSPQGPSGLADGRELGEGISPELQKTITQVVAEE